jgi:hypothetical protein
MIKRCSLCFKDKVFRRAFAMAMLLLVVSLIVNFYAGTYATKKASNSVTDIVLDNIPVFDVDEVFVYGAYALVACITFVCFSRPRKLPFAVKSIALFYLIRSAFVTLTHIAPFPTHTAIDPLSYMRFFDFGSELFFSGHTGLPFLMALIFWDEKWLRIGFIIASVAFGVVVLMGHLHYSIDVFAAFFITYAIYGIAEQVFRKDKELAHAPSLGTTL